MDVFSSQWRVIFSPLWWWVLGLIGLQTGAGNAAEVPVPSPTPSAMGSVSPGLAPWACLAACLWPQLWPIPAPLYRQAIPSLTWVILYSGTVGLHPGQWRHHLRWVTLSSHLITPLGPALLFTTWQKERKKCSSLWWVRKNPVKKTGNKVSVHAEEFLGFTEQHTSSLWKNDSSRKTLNKKIYKCR